MTSGTISFICIHLEFARDLTRITKWDKLNILLKYFHTKKAAVFGIKIIFDF